MRTGDVGAGLLPALARNCSTGMFVENFWCECLASETPVMTFDLPGVGVDR